MFRWTGTYLFRGKPRAIKSGQIRKTWNTSIVGTTNRHGSSIFESFSWHTEFERERLFRLVCVVQFEIFTKGTLVESCCQSSYGGGGQMRRHWNHVRATRSPSDRWWLDTRCWYRLNVYCFFCFIDQHTDRIILGFILTQSFLYGFLVLWLSIFISFVYIFCIF